MGPLEDNDGNILTPVLLIAEALNKRFKREYVSSLPTPVTKF